jgi:hypothetical protein
VLICIAKRRIVISWERTGLVRGWAVVTSLGTAGKLPWQALDTGLLLCLVGTWHGCRRGVFFGHALELPR